MRDRSLDEFVGGGDADAGDDDPGEAGEADAHGTAASDARVDGVNAGDDPDADEDADAGEDPDPDADEDAGEDPDADGDADADTDRIAPDAVGPVVATSRWTPDGEGCPRCGAAVRRTWYDGDAADASGADGAFVCRDCVPW